MGTAAAPLCEDMHFVTTSSPVCRQAWEPDAGTCLHTSALSSHSTANLLSFA